MRFSSLYTFLARNTYLFPLSIVLLTVVMLALTLSPAETLGNNSIWDYDKLGHLILFGGWTYILGLYNQMTNITSGKIKNWMIALSGILFGLIVELLQYGLPVHRHADPVDFAADTIGCIIAIGILRYTPEEVRRKTNQ